MSISRISTVWCDGLDGNGVDHAEGCPRWSGDGFDASEARKVSEFVHHGRGRDYSRVCLDALCEVKEAKR